MPGEDEHGAPGGGSGLNKHIGPAPLWLWAVGLGALGGIVWFWKRSKSGTAAADSAAAGSGDTTPTSLVPINEGLSQAQTEALLTAIKKLHGPPSDDDDDGQDDDDDDKPKPKPKPKPREPRTVTTVKWHPSPHTPWNSTLWGIAQHEHVKGGWQYLEKINHIHGDPRKALQPGMKIKLGT